MSALCAALGLRRQTVPPVVSRSMWRRFMAQPSGRAGLALTALVLIIVFVGPFLVPYDPDQIDLSNKLAPPSAEHLLGTDQFGRDQLSRLLDGGRRSLGAAFIVLISVLVIGLTVGITAGMAGGMVDALLMRLVDVLLALPSLVLALAIVGVLGPGFQNLLLALILSWWAYYARLTRSYVLAARQRQDVIADRLAGIRWPRIVRGHILPGVLPQMLIVVTLDLGGIIISIAGLSFLGLGVQPPHAEWGAMLAGARLFFSTAPWLLLAPAGAILLSVVASNLVGNALRDAAGPGRTQ